MKEKKINNRAFFKDLSWYFLGSFVPLLIGFAKTPIFTRHFNKEDYGYLGIVTITFTYLGMVLFSWIGSCIWRYYSKYETEKKLTTLYTNLAFLYFISMVVLLTITLIWYGFANHFLVKQLIFYSFFQILLNQLFLFYMVLIRLKGKAKFYTIFQSVRAFFSIIIALAMVFILKSNISALVSSLVFLDALVLLFLFIFNPAKVTFKYHFISKKRIKELITYGGVGLILNVSLLVITTSDRYIIAWFSNLANVGIYDQVYKLGQISVVALVTIFFNTINPLLLKELELNFDNSVSLIRKYLKPFFIYGLPIIIYLSIFSKDISTLFLGEEFRVGYTILPFVFLAAYLQGLSSFYELRLKFSNKFRRLSIIAIAAAVLNILLTFIFVGLYGYKWAAITTVISYLVLIVLLHYFDNEILKFTRKNRKVYYKIIVVLTLQIAIYILLDYMWEINLLEKLMMITFFVLTYYLLLKKELKSVEIPI